MRQTGRLVVALGAALWLTWACGSRSDWGNDGTPGQSGSGGDLIGAAGENGLGANGSGATGNGVGGSNGRAGSSASGGDNGTLTGNAGASSVEGGASSGPPQCSAFGQTCVQSDECCSGVCDAKTRKCASVVSDCSASGAACAAPTDCCSLSCVGNKCSGTVCVSDAQKCTSAAQCCSGSCTNGTCGTLNTSCKTAGNKCAKAADCCSGDCGQDGTCTLGGSFCIQPGDVCARPTDCCSGVCDIKSGAKVGTCSPPPGGATFCTGVDGVRCETCGDCCSRLCAPFGATGVKICQPANGCHVTGDLCRRNEDCCGGTVDSALPGYGNVKCEIADGADIGICRTPTNGPGPGGACNPQGNVCHFKDYACNVSSTRADCCGGLGAKGGVCQLDPLGIPRCNGLGDSCRAAGDSCASTDDCCDGLPCVPDAKGLLHCGTMACQKSGDTCTVDADCCPGTPCVRAPGSVDGTCSGSNGGGGSGGTGGGGPGGGTGGTDTGGAATGGTGGSGTGGTPNNCSSYGQACQGDADCCPASPAIPCTKGICRYPTG